MLYKYFPFFVPCVTVTKYNFDFKYGACGLSWHSGKGATGWANEEGGAVINWNPESVE